MARTIGTAEDITWTVSGGAFVSFTVELSTDNGQTYSELTSGLSADTRAYSWTPTAAQESLAAFVRVTGVAPGRSQSDTNNTSFAVQASVALTSPNGGESLAAGIETTVTWTKSGTFTSFDLDLSYDNGSNWSSVTTGISGASTSYAWTVPTGTESATCLLRITGHTAVTDYTDTSDAVFDISAVSDPWTSVANTRLFFIAEDATFSGTSVTAQSDLSGGSSLSGVSPYLLRLASPDYRYGSSGGTNGRVERADTNGVFVFSAVIRGRLLSGNLGGLGMIDRTSFAHKSHDLYVTGGNIVSRWESDGSGTDTLTISHGGVSNDETHTFGVTHSSGSATFYLDGVLLGTTGGGSSGTPSLGGADNYHFIGARYQSTAPGAGVERQGFGAFVGGMIASGSMDADDHANAHNWFVLNAAD